MPLWHRPGVVELHPFIHCSVHLLTDFTGYPDDHQWLFFEKAPRDHWNLLTLEWDPWKCDHRSHEEGPWYERCPRCGVTDP